MDSTIWFYSIVRIKGNIKTINIYVFIGDVYVPPPRKQVPRSDSQDTPTSPLFDEDQSVPLEVFPRIEYNGEIWEMQLRQPNKKKIASQRYKNVFFETSLSSHYILLSILFYSNVSGFGRKFSSNLGVQMTIQSFSFTIIKTTTNRFKNFNCSRAIPSLTSVINSPINLLN